MITINEAKQKISWTEYEMKMLVKRLEEEIGAEVKSITVIRYKDDGQTISSDIKLTVEL